MATVTQQLDPTAATFLTSAFPQMVRNGTNFPVSALAYDAATDEAAFWVVRAVSYGVSNPNVTITIDWYADTATSGVVVWEIQLAAITPDTDSGDVEAKALATLQTVSDTHLGTTGQRLHRCSVAMTNLDSLSADDDLWIRVARDANNAADTLTGDAHLVLATVAYPDA